MPLQAGSRLGPYEVIALAGAGGMGEVYQARDTRLDRTVAIKVLASGQTGDAAARQRFEREARTISALSHPHICPLFDIGHHEGADYLVMEYLEGETLAARLSRGKLPLDQVLNYGIQIADALAASHRAGIIHRDLKPGNIMLTNAGVKLLDFGLAKPRQAVTTGQTETALRQPLTDAGLIVGTLQYMAPEQLAGHEADSRTDIFSLGTILYEMLTGRHPFGGSSQATLIGNILHSEAPPIDGGEPPIVSILGALLRHCLAKDSDRRVQSAHDMFLALSWIRDGGRPAAAVDRGRWRERLTWILVPLVALAATALTWLLLTQRSDTRPATRFIVAEPFGVTWHGESTPSLSPDGRQLAVIGTEASGKTRLWVRALESSRFRPIEGLLEPRGDPVWGPDSRSIVVADGGKLKKVDTAGGIPQVLCDLPAEGGFSGAWNREDVILFAVWPGPLYRVSMSGGRPVPATQLDPQRQEASHSAPSFLPSGRDFLYGGYGSEASIYVGHLGSLERTHVKNLEFHNNQAIFVSPGRLVFTRDRRLIEQPFDLAHLRVEGQERVLETGARVESFSISGTGTLVYRAASEALENAHGLASATNSRLAWFDRTGRELETVAPLGGYYGPRLAPDGKMLMVERFDTGNLGDLWSFDLRRKLAVRVTSERVREGKPAWSRGTDGVVFSRETGESGGGEIVLRDPAGAERVVHRLDPPANSPMVCDWSPDGRFVIYETWWLATGNDLFVVSVDGGAAVPFATRFDEGQARFSVDGRWVAYTSNQSGRSEIYVRAFPFSGAPTLVSTRGGEQPAWSGNGQELYYVAPDHTLMAAPVRPVASFEVGPPVALFRLPTGSQYEPALDGQRFLVNVVNADAVEPGQTVAVLDWVGGLDNVDK